MLIPAERLHRLAHATLCALGSTTDEASVVAEELRQALRAAPCRSGALEIAVSASIGVHCVDLEARDSLESALQVADQALYAAKAEGRDCVRTL